MRIANTIKATGLFLALLATLALSGSVPATAQTPTVTDIHSFNVGDGNYPYAALLQASDGYLYGSTQEGGANNNGTVFKITPAGVLTSLHSFDFADGYNPLGTLLQGKDGNLYGTTYYGTTYYNGSYGSGTIFKITTAGVLTTLYAFSDKNDGVNKDGAGPVAGLIQATDGNLYGTTSGGGTTGSGTIFRITTGGTFTSLYTFSAPSVAGTNTDGDGPSAPLIQASDGNLYGITDGGGANGFGTIFKITTAGKLTTIHSFTSGYGGNGGLIQAADGSLYGTTQYGGSNGTGTIFGITTSGSFTSLYSFSALSNGNSGTNSDGANPSGSLIQATDGSLYGTTQYGGSNDTGTIFRITTSGSFTSLYSFSALSEPGFYSPNSDGAWPWSGLIQASDGYLYGTTPTGGLNGDGTVFRLSGVYPVPVVTSISPSSTNAVGPAFTLTVKGSAFQSVSIVNWNGSPLATSYTSPTALKATVPASLITAPGKASITVVTPAGGGTSKSKTFTIIVTTLKLKAAKLTRDTSKNTLTAVVTLSNTGFLTAKSTKVTKATLNGTAATNLPKSAGSIAAKRTGTATLVFPSAAGPSGQKVALQVSGTFAGGTFSGSLKVTLP